MSSLKHLAMLSTISYHHKHQNYNDNNNNNTNYNNNHQTTTTTTTTNETYKYQEKQQQQQQPSQQIITPLFLENSTTITTTTIRSTDLLYSYKNTTNTTSSASASPKSADKNEISESVETISDIKDIDSSSYGSESSESVDQIHPAKPGRGLTKTYTSTTYYGSGFGVFHQQNARSSSGGGIALITGSTASNGLGGGGGGGGSYSNGINNNVNLLLGGAMLTLVTTILCVVCYCCHRNIKKRTEAAYRQQRQWLENDPNMEIYSVEQCYETSGLFVGESIDGLAAMPALHHEPPPSYDAVVAMQEQQQLLAQQQRHQQQQLIIQQQQLLQQQLATNNSPPPGYRSSLDVRATMQPTRLTARAGVLMVGGSIVSGLEINSLVSSTANMETCGSISPIDPLLNYEDVNGNAASVPPVATVTPTNHNSRTTAIYLRSKQQQPQDRNSATNQTQINMKKVLQAQSCCSLQRAEVENMWNAAAAALAARSAHLPCDSRASTTASTSSPTLALNIRKQTQGCKTSNTNTTETFGTRYLKQNYYRRGCPLCGKFRYDNDSTLSTSMESNLETLTDALTEEPAVEGRESELETRQDNANNNENLRKALEEGSPEEFEEMVDSDENTDDGDSNVKMQNNATEEESQCSCVNAKGKKFMRLSSQNIEENLNTERSLRNSEEQQVMEINENERSSETVTAAVADNNANCTLTAETPLTNQLASNNNNDNTNLQDCLSLPCTSTASSCALPCSTTPFDSSPPSAASTPSITINLDRINENGIISLDMSKIIDKTGLPTYDAALKLESSGYV